MFFSWKLRPFGLPAVTLASRLMEINCCERRRISAALDHFISFHFISFHFISFHFISFHFISFHFISFHFISFHFISSNEFNERLCPRAWSAWTICGLRAGRLSQIAISGISRLRPLDELNRCFGSLPYLCPDYACESYRTLFVGLLIS